MPAQEKLADGVMAEILRLREDTEELHLAKQNIEEAYDALLEEYQAKHAESESYYLQAVDTTAKLNAIKPKKLITTTLGTAAVYHQGSYGIDVTAGVNFGPAGVFVGATYMFGEDSFLAMGDMAYKAGLTFTF